MVPLVWTRKINNSFKYQTNSLTKFSWFGLFLLGLVLGDLVGWLVSLEQMQKYILVYHHLHRHGLPNTLSSSPTSLLFRFPGGDVIGLFVDTCSVQHLKRSQNLSLIQTPNFEAAEKISHPGILHG